MSAPAALPQRGDIPFAVDGRHAVLPPVSTRVWLDALIYEPPACWWRLLPGELDTGTAVHLVNRLDDPADPLDIDDLEKYALTVLETRLGTGFFAAQRLVRYARGNWALFDGWMVEHGGTDPLDMPIDRVCHAVYSLRVQSAEKESERRRIESQTFAPPEGTRASGRAWADDPAVTRQIDEIESAAFMQAMAMSR